MFYLLATLLVVLNAFWLGLVVVGLPGTWLMVITTLLFAWWQGSGEAVAVFALPTLIGMVVLAVVGEILEFAAGVVGSHRAGGSRGGAIGALVGGLLGGIAATFVIPIPVVGSLIGACAGAFLGALLMELKGGRGLSDSFRSGMGAGKGRLLGTVAKIGVGAAIWLVAAVGVFWP